MVMRPDIVAGAVDAVVARGAPGPLVYLSPRGEPLRQARVAELAAGPGVVLLCGRYEGVDHRVIEARGFLEVSLGDFVLSGGELAAMALIDACVRLLPGVVGDAASLAEESFAAGLLEYPHYTRPQVWEGRAVRTCSCPGTTPGSASGATSRRRRSRSPGGRIWSGPLGNETVADGRMLPPPQTDEDAMNLIAELEQEQLDRLVAERGVPDFRPGDTLRVNVKVIEGTRERVQAFEGVCIARRNRGINSAFTVRKISYGEGVERVFPLHSPRIDSIDVVRRGRVRRAKLYYLRGRTGKSARIAERRDDRPAPKAAE